MLRTSQVGNERVKRERETSFPPPSKEGSDAPCRSCEHHNIGRQNEIRPLPPTSPIRNATNPVDGPVLRLGLENESKTAKYESQKSYLTLNRTLVTERFWWCGEDFFF